MLTVSNFQNNFSNNKIKIPSQSDTLMESLSLYFNKRENLEKMKEIISGKSKISLRLLDWLCTNHSKKFGTSFVTYFNGRPKNFFIFLEYKKKLKGYSKDLFDPFCRGERIDFLDHDDAIIETTVGQLNFFRWALENDIIKYAEENLDEIDEDMRISLKDKYKKKTKGSQRRKRTALSISATKSIKRYDVSIVVKFD